MAPFLALLLAAPDPLAVLPIVDQTTGAANPEVNAATLQAARALQGVEVISPSAVEAVLSPTKGSTSPCEAGTLAERTSLDCLPALGARLRARFLLTGQVQNDELATGLTVSLFDVSTGKLIASQRVAGTGAARPNDLEQAAQAVLHRILTRSNLPRHGIALIRAPDGWIREVDGIRLAADAATVELAEGTHWVEAAPGAGNEPPSRGTIDVLAGEKVAYDVLTADESPIVVHRHPHIALPVALIVLGAAVVAGSFVIGEAGVRDSDINAGNGLAAVGTIGLNVGLVAIASGVGTLLSGL
jgi:hypothetical protein